MRPLWKKPLDQNKILSGKINNNLKNKDHFDPYNVFLAIATNIPVRLKTGFVVQGHICVCVCVCDPGPQKQS